MKNRFTKYGWLQFYSFSIVFLWVSILLALTLNQWSAIIFMAIVIWSFEYGYSRGRHPENHYSEYGMSEMKKTEKETKAIKDATENLKQYIK